MLEVKLPTHLKVAVEKFTFGNHDVIVRTKWNVHSEFLNLQGCNYNYNASLQQEDAVGEGLVTDINFLCAIS